MIMYSVLAGCVYAIFFQNNFYIEQVPEAFAPPPYTRSIWSSNEVKLEPTVRMILVQLGSCQYKIERQPVASQAVFD